MNESEEPLLPVVKAMLDVIRRKSPTPAAALIQRSNFIALEYNLPLDLARVIDTVGCVFGALSAERAVEQEITGGSIKSRTGVHLLTAFTIAKHAGACFNAPEDSIARALTYSFAFHARTATIAMGEAIGKELGTDRL